ncbi:site-specific integrase [Aquidulcibacter sp.]|uniref:tyrosine-type recombinase/integrase n=1 Tax=Aquidulcibacter sp. TaxID=2052990 RepID=UPI0025BCC5D8|nr:site-specific integrase [Aquidulcibacter sp.]
MASRIRIAKGIAIYQREDAQGWWCDLSRYGKRVKESLGTENRKTATALATQRWTEISPTSVEYTLKQAVNAWLNERPRAQTDISALRVLLEKYPDRPCALVDSTSLRAALRDKKPAWYNRIIAVVRAALNLAVAQDKLAVCPKLARQKPPPSRNRFLRGDEYVKLRAELPPHLVPAFDFALATGQRQANVLGLKWSQIHGDVMVINSADFKQRRGHSIPLGEHAMKILAGCRGYNPEYVFTYRGQPIKSPKTAYTSAKERAGLEDVTWHDLRHTFASWLLMSGAPLVAVKEAGGWADMGSVARYAHLEKKQLADYADGAMDALIGTKNGTNG